MTDIVKKAENIMHDHKEQGEQRKKYTLHTAVNKRLKGRHFSHELPLPDTYFH